MGKYPPILPGKRYGRLVAIREDVDKKWLCKCDCGNTKVILGASLKSGVTRSCGCLRKEKAAIVGTDQRTKNEYKVLENKIEVFYKDKKFFISKESKWVLKYSWRIDKSGYVSTFLYNRKNQTPLHQILLKDELAKPENKNKMPDHIDGNPSNNCLDNLRIVSNRQNSLNKEKRKNFGIYKTKYKTNPYQVILGKNRKCVYIGLFPTIELAREARDKWIDENDKERYKYNRN